jgi:hypothetical protein
MNHRANVDFWNDYHALPADILARADKQFALLKKGHPSLQFKKLGERQGKEIWCVRVTLKYRALAVKFPEEYLWFWIGEPNIYDVLIRWRRVGSRQAQTSCFPRSAALLVAGGAAAGSAESLQLGLCGLALWGFNVGTLIAEELFNVKSRRVAKAATLRYLLLRHPAPL